jgi:hypothetical protein
VGRLPGRSAQRSSVPGAILRLAAAGERDGAPAPQSSRPADPVPLDGLPYYVELWETGKTYVEQVLAVTASGAIGYAAYYAATREYPGRYITLRHHDNILSRWHGPEN